MRITLALVLVLVTASFDAHAIPAFNRQTGQNCVACHAGGQFPDLTAYGRLFKLTGYTIGTRSLPLARSTTRTAVPPLANAADLPSGASASAPMFVEQPANDRSSLPVHLAGC